MSQHQNKQRNRWTFEDDEQLKKLIQLNGTEKKAWRIISEAMTRPGVVRTLKSCKDRYKNHLQKIDTTSPNFEELLELIQIHGNKWSTIANQMNKTELQVKNCFYSNVRKILRRLYKLTLNDQKGAKHCKLIKPSMMTNMFCKEPTSCKKIIIPDVVRNTFHKLIYENINYGKEKFHNLKDLDEQTKDQVKFIKGFLENKQEICLYLYDQQNKFDQPEMNDEIPEKVKIDKLADTGINNEAQNPKQFIPNTEDEELCFEILPPQEQAVIMNLINSNGSNYQAEYERPYNILEDGTF